MRRIIAACIAVIAVAAGAQRMLAEGTETLGPVPFPLAVGTGVVVAGVGMEHFPNQPNAFTFQVPAGAAVKQVLLYWEGHWTRTIPEAVGTPVLPGIPQVDGDSEISVNGVFVSGTKIGGSTNFFPQLAGGYYAEEWYAAYRADITGMVSITPGDNTLTISDMMFASNFPGGGEFTKGNDGAGVLVIYDTGGAPATIDVRDGLDMAYDDLVAPNYFAPPLDKTTPQTFTFAPSPADRPATLATLAGNVLGTDLAGTLRSNQLVVTFGPGGEQTVYNNLWQSNQGFEFDAVNQAITIPANATSVTVEAISGGPEGIPASLAWIVAALSIGQPQETASPAINIKKYTNGEDADTPTGPLVPVGSTVTWTYVVTNGGNVPLANVTVTDNIAGVTPVYQSGDGNADGLLDVTETWLFVATGTAISGQYANVGTTTGTHGTTQVSDNDPSHYFGVASPAIELTKLTNGSDNNSPTGPVVGVGSTVTFTYIVRNTGDVPLSNVVVTDDNGTAGNPADDFVVCTIPSLAVGASQTCTASRIATAGQYVNWATATGKHDTQTVSDTDVDHHFGAAAAISLVKLTNGTDNNSPTGPVVPVGSTVTFTYRVTNTGNAPLANVVVRDDNGTPANTADDFTVCTIASLAAGATQTCTATRIATAGQYVNWATVTGSHNGQTVTDKDLDHHYGAAPAIALVKLTNGTNNNTPTGPVVSVGSTVTWTYRVTNTGTVPLSNVVVRDDNGTPANTADDKTVCTLASLAVGQTSTCTLTGTAIEGQYANLGTATGTHNGTTVKATDPDHYFGRRQFADETASGTGTKYPGSSNWFMYTPYTTTRLNLIAGQKYVAGDIYMSRSGSGATARTTIRIVLRDGWRWADVDEVLKINPYASAPTRYYEPGSFLYKFTAPNVAKAPNTTVVFSGNTVTVTMPGTSAKFYGIHGDVERKLP